MIILLSKRNSIVSEVTVKEKPSELNRMLPLCVLTSVQCPLKHGQAVEDLRGLNRSSTETEAIKEPVKRKISNERILMRFF